MRAVTPVHVIPKLCVISVTSTWEQPFKPEWRKRLYRICACNIACEGRGGETYKIHFVFQLRPFLRSFNKSYSSNISKGWLVPGLLQLLCNSSWQHPLRRRRRRRSHFDVEERSRSNFYCCFNGFDSLAFFIGKYFMVQRANQSLQTRDPYQNMGHVLAQNSKVKSNFQEGSPIEQVSNLPKINFGPNLSFWGAHTCRPNGWAIFGIWFGLKFSTTISTNKTGNKIKGKGCLVLKQN